MAILIGVVMLQYQSYGQDQPVEGNYTNRTLNQVLVNLEQRYSIKFFYLEEWLPVESVDIAFENTPLSQALDLLLENTNLSYFTYGNDKIIIAEKSRIADIQSPQLVTFPQESESTNLDNRFPVLEVGDASSVVDPTNNPVEIQVVDKFEERVLPGVVAFFEHQEKTVNTDNQGRSKISLPLGVHQVELRLVGYLPFICNLRVLSGGTVRIEMEQEAIELREVVVSGENAAERILTPQSGIVTLSPKQIKEMPVFLGEADVIKTIQTIPGVTTIGEGAPGFFVRGGNADQNLILQDEVIFSNSSHALGFFSLFNPDLISKVQLYKGSIPAQFGGRLSSILDVQLKGNNYTTTTISGGVGTVLSKLAVETPLVKDKVSVLAGARISYADWLLPVVKIPEVKDSEAFFYDLNLKLSGKISKNGTISAGYFQSFDRVDFQNEAGFEWAIRSFSFDWSQGIGESIQSELKASWGQTENLNFDPTGLDLTELTNGLEFFKLKEVLSFSAGKHLITAGGEWIDYRPQDEVLSSTNTLDDIDRLPKDYGQEWAVFANDEWELNQKVAVSLGLRTSYFSSTEQNNSDQKTSYLNVEPRISARYGINQASSIKASYNRMSQYMHLLSNTTGVLPIDQWIASNSTIKPSTSDNFSLGYFRNFNANDWESSAEVFYRRMDQLIEFRDFADLILNPELEEEILQGDGEAYGLELFLRRHTGKVKGNLSYTFSRTFIEVPLVAESNELLRFPARFDRPHSLNLVMDWTVNRKSKFGLVFNYTSGRPITAPVSSYRLGNVVVPNYSDRNEYRIPSYHRLDLSYTYRRNAVKRRRYQDSITFSIYNIYSRRNAFSVFFRKENNRPPQAYRLSVLGSAFPSITYTFEFK